MSDTPNKFYLTTPIYYVNARPHIGHAYTTIAADVIARRHRLLGPPIGEDGFKPTFFLTGTDEHGQKIQRSAEAAGIPPQQFADEVSASFQNLWKRMGITNNKFIRTTDEAHKRGVQQLFTQLQRNGFIELRSYTGQYCISDETFVDVPVGTPCPECGRITETVTEENYFFKLSQFQRQLIDLIESNTLAIQPDSRKNEVLSFLRGDFKPFIDEYKRLNLSTPTIEQNEADLTVPAGDDLLGAFNLDGIERSAKGTPYVLGALKDLSISRTSVKWGIPVPGDEKHVIYVWLDALSNYMTAIGYGAENRTDLTDEEKKQEQARFEKYWPADLHLVGKEIIRFHCVYWPAFLLALNPDLAGKTPDDLPFEDHLNWAKDWLPKAITAHGWLLFEESKMSKSRGNIVRTETILDAFGTLLPLAPNAASTSSSETALQSEESRVPHLRGGLIAAKVGEASPTSALLGAPSAESQEPTSSASLAPTARLIPAQGNALSQQIDEKGGLKARPITPDAAWKHEQDLFAADVLRYFLLREIPFGNDGSFSFDALVTRYNSDLANGYGNLVSRTLSMTWKYFDGINPNSPNAGDFVIPAFGTFQHEIIPNVVMNHVERFVAAIDRLAFSSALEIWASLVGATDGYITGQAPWKLASDETKKSQLAEVLYTAAETIRIATALIYPIMPHAASKVWAQLGLGDIEEAAQNGDLKNLQWGGLKPGTKLGERNTLFPSIKKEDIPRFIQLMNDMEASNATKPEGLKSVELSKSVIKPAGLPLINNNNDAGPHHRTEFAESPISSESATASLNPIAETVHPITAHHPEEAEPRPETPQIAIDDFIKIDLRVAQIVVAERIPKADKLLRLEVDLGYERRQILTGIAQWYTPEELIGRRIVVIANLAPRKMRGLESHGMLLAASHGDDGKPILATFGEDIALGSRLK